MSTNVQVNVYILYAWQRLCEALTEDMISDAALNMPLLKSKFGEIKQLMFAGSGINIHEQLQKIFSECGITLRIVKHFRGAPVHGFIRRLNDGHIILCLTIRRARADVFWFTLFHEIAHILNGDLSEHFMDFSLVKSDVEAKADELARSLILDDDEYLRFARAGDFSFESIKRFSRTQNVPPYMVIGRLQSDELIGWDRYASELIYYKWVDD